MKNWRIPYLFAADWIQRHYRLVIGFVAMAIACLGSVNYINAPIVGRTEVTGTIVSFLNWPPDPESAVGRGFRYEYGVEIDDAGGIAYARDRAGRPRPVGSRVTLERRDRENGIVTFHFK